MDVDDFLGDIDAIVAVNFLNLINGNNVGTMNAQKLVLGQHLLYGFHRQMGDQCLGLVVKIEQHIVFHTIDISDLVDGYVAPFAVNADKDGIRFCLNLQRKGKEN